MTDRTDKAMQDRYGITLARKLSEGMARISAKTESAIERTPEGAERRLSLAIVAGEFSRAITLDIAVLIARIRELECKLEDCESELESEHE